MPDLTRDQRLLIVKYREDGHSKREIMRKLNVTYNQVSYMCRDDVPITPQKKRKTGRQPKLSAQTVDNITSWIRQSPGNRAMSYHDIVKRLNLPVSGETLRLTLKKREKIGHPPA